MKILVTGATGFVGSHSAAALLRAGHSVRFLARNPTALRQHFTNWGLAADDVLQADMQDAAAVRKALHGCDGVLHAAASVNLDPAHAAATYRSNLAGVQHVLGAACELGLPRMVYVSSLSVLFTPDLPRLDENSPLAASRNAYTQSKTAAERLVRQWQAAGQPIQTTYPAAIIGPDDPKLCASNAGLRTFASKTLPLTRTGFQLVDVRDLAALHLRLLEQNPSEQTGRYIVGGHYLPWRDLAAALQSVMGRKPPTVALPAPVLRGLAALADMVQRVHPFDTQLTGEAVAFMTRWSPADSSRVLAHTGYAFRPVEHTLADTLAWMVQAGHLRSDFSTSP